MGRDKKTQLLTCPLRTNWNVRFSEQNNHGYGVVADARTATRIIKGSAMCQADRDLSQMRRPSHYWAVRGAAFRAVAFILMRCSSLTDALIGLKVGDRRWLLKQSGQQKECIEQHGFEDTVVWNPCPAKAASKGDMPTNDWIHMLRVETAQVHRQVQLNLGELWVGGQTLRVVGP